MDNMEERSDSDDSTTSNESRFKRWQKQIFPTGFLAELKPICHLAWSLFLTELFQFLFGTISIAFCGHLGKLELDSAALAISLMNVTGLSVMLGLSSGCDTLFSQLYGSEHKGRIGVALQRSILILLLCLLPCFAVHINAEALLLAMGQNPDVARLAGNYMLTFMPGLLCFCLYIPLSKYLQCQNIVIPNIIIGFTANCVNAICHYVSLYVMETDIMGSAISQVIGYFTMLVLTFLYIIISKAYKETWHGVSKECILEWGNFGQLAIFGLLMLCIEWWSFEIGVIMSGLLGTTELGAQSILFQLSDLCYMIPLGIGIATSIRVGQFLGASQGEHAKTTTRVAFVLIWVISAVLLILLVSLRSYLPAVFTSAEDVKALVTSVLPAVAAYLMFDATNAVGCGILRGMGHQHVGTCFMAFAYGTGLAAGIPTLLLTDLGVIGYWWCLSGAVFLESCMLLTYILRCDWDKEVRKARERIRTETLKEESDSQDEKSNQDEKPDLYENSNLYEKPHLDENTPLLRSKNSHARNHIITPRIIAHRMALILSCLLVLAIGVTVRLTVPIQPVDFICVDNSTMNGTTLTGNGTEVIC